jgi:hypothetical protein
MQRPTPQAVPAIAPSAPSGEAVGLLEYLALPPAWIGALIAVPIGLKLGSPVAAIVLAALGLALGITSFVLAQRRGRAWQWWGVASLTAVLAAGSALYAGAGLPRKEVAKADDTTIEPYADTWELPDAKKQPLTTSILTAYPNHIVVFTTEVTNVQEVADILEQLFPGRVIPAPRDDTKKRDELLKKQLEESIKSLQADPKEVKALLEAIAKSNVRFKGYRHDVADPLVTLEGVIRRGGVFTLSPGEDPSQEKHGSLMHARGISDLTSHAGRTDDRALELLKRLRDAVRDYASLYDALAVSTNRRAYLIRVKPNREDHEEAARLLLERLGNPVFVPRPPPRLFDAVDPSEGGAKGESSYELRVPTPYYWRQVGQADRVGLKQPWPSPRMKWEAKAKNASVTWEQISIRRKPIASFDVAVQNVPGQVVIFRNQNLFFGPRAEEIEK